jgi:hypothetical protein
MGGVARLAAALILAACALKEVRALEDGKGKVLAFQAAGSLWQSSVHHRLGPNHADHERIKKARLKTVETSSAAAGGKKKPLRFHSATSERFGKMLRALKTGTRRSGDGVEKVGSPSGGVGAGAELRDHSADQTAHGPPSAIDALFASMDTDGDGCVTQAEFNEFNPSTGRRLLQVRTRGVRRKWPRAHGRPWRTGRWAHVGRPAQRSPWAAGSGAWRMGDTRPPQAAGGEKGKKRGVGCVLTCECCVARFALPAAVRRMLDKTRLHSKMLRAWMVKLLAFR